MLALTFKILFSVIQGLLIFLAAYILVLSIAGLLPRRGGGKQVDDSRPRRFAIVIPARNEQAVIANILRSVRALSYPDRLYHAYVVADSCTDRTAEIARGCGAIVFHREPQNDEILRRSKAQALEFFFGEIEKADLSYDAYVVMDADNVLTPSFLQEMNHCLSAGYEVVQGLRASKNPEGNWIARLDDAAEAVAFLEQRGRVRLGLSARLTGSAMALSQSFFQAIGGWKVACSSETAELMALAALHGFPIAWCPSAVAFDEKVSSVPQLSGQRARWLRAGFEVLRRYFFRVLWRGIQERDYHKAEQALYLLRLQIPRNLLIAICAFLLGLSVLGWFPAPILHWCVWAFLLAAHLLCFIAALLVQRSSWRTYVALLLSPVFILVYLRALLGVFVGARIPVRTEHSVKTTGDRHS